MLKATFTLKDGKKALVLGIDKENVRRLQEDKPIRFDAAEVGLPGWEVVVVYGETIDVIKEKLLGAKQ